MSIWSTVREPRPARSSTRSRRWPTSLGDRQSTSEQATGIEQVDKALTQMDEVTQQNSARVEEMSDRQDALASSACHGSACCIFSNRRRCSCWTKHAADRHETCGFAVAGAPTDGEEAEVGRSGGSAGTGAQARGREPRRRTGWPHAGRARHGYQRRTELEGVLALAMS